MKNITRYFNDRYEPFKVLVIHQSTAPADQQDSTRNIYIESYDLDSENRPINARPFNLKDMCSLADILQASDQIQSAHLWTKGILPSHILHLDPASTGRVIWYSPAQKVNLLFSERLGLPNGKAYVPTLVWKADPHQLSLYAIKEDERPVLETPLFKAPFFNVFARGEVCMGSVKVDLSHCSCLEEFTHGWEQYFWNSYFSHLVENSSPVRGNIVQLWQSLIGSQTRFPVDQLTPSPYPTLKKILV